MRLRGGGGPSTVHNQITGGSAEYVVMTGAVHGGIHVHLRRPESAGPSGSLGFLVPAAAAVGLFSQTDSTVLRAVAGLLLAVAAWQARAVLRRARTREVFVPDARLDAAAAVLASRLRFVYEREERLTRVFDPVPLRVRWQEGDPLLADHWINVRDGESGPLDLSGELRDVAEHFSRLPLRRLVVLGAAGAGKSVLALRLAHSLLDSDEPGRPVPVVLPLASWDPERLGPWEWAGRRLAALHPELAATDTEREILARALLDSGRVLPLFDGFDELPEGSRARALSHLNAALGRGRGLVLTSRPEAYADAVRATDVLTAAAVIHLQPLTADDVMEFLPRSTRRSGRREALTTKWDPVLRRLCENRADPAAARLRAVLSTPLMVGLARVAYSDTDADPEALLDTRRFPDRQSLERHLLDAYVPAVYRIALDDAGARGPWNEHQARRWLAFLARHLQQEWTQDLAWWRLTRATGSPVGALPTVMGIAALMGAMYGTGAGRAVPDGLLHGPLWLTFGLVTLPGLILWWAIRTRHQPPGPRRLAPVRAWRPWRPVDSLTAPADLGSAPGPLKVLKDDRVASLVTGLLRPAQGEGQAWSTSLALLLVFPVFLLEWHTYGLDWGHAADSADLTVLLAAWAAAVLLHGLAHTAWGRYVVTRLWLAARGRLPWRLDAFLEDARRRGVLRQAGGVYQFRHLELRDRLADHRSPGRRPDNGRARLLAPVNSLGQGLTAAALLFWGVVGVGNIPGADGPYTKTAPTCTLLSAAQLRPVMSRPEKVYEHQDTCTWAESGAGRDAVVRVTVTVYRAEHDRGGAGRADAFVAASGTPLSGVGDRATLQSFAASAGDEGRSFAEGGRAATVTARAGNVSVQLTYEEELATHDRVTAVATVLTQQVLHRALGLDPPQHALTAIPLPKAPPGSRFSRYTTPEHPTSVFGAGTWRPGERTKLYDLAGVPFVFQAPRLSCSKQDAPLLWVCDSDVPPTSGDWSGAAMALSVRDCGRNRCSEADTQRFATSFRWYDHAGKWRYADASTQYNDARSEDGKTYGTELFRRLKANGRYYLLALRAYARADRSDLPRKTLDDVCSHTVPAIR